MKTLIRWLKSFKRKPCECGNPVSCTDTEHKFMVLYDIVDTGPFSAKFRLNSARAMRCHKFNEWRSQDPDRIFR